MSKQWISDSAVVAETVMLGLGVSIWHFAQVRERAVIGDNVIIGKGAYVGEGVTIGSNSKIQNNALIYAPAALEDGVFIGPGAILTNDRYPKAVNIDLTFKSSDDWQPVGVRVGLGASIGAGAICVAPVKIGMWAVVGAGSVVTRDVPDFGMVVGNPARQVAWVGKSGQKLESTGIDTYRCSFSNSNFKLSNGVMVEI